MSGFIQGLGGVKNIMRVEVVAETRLGMVVNNEGKVNDAGLQTAGLLAKLVSGLCRDDASDAAQLDWNCWYPVNEEEL